MKQDRPVAPIEGESGGGDGPPRVTLSERVTPKR